MTPHTVLKIHTFDRTSQDLLNYLVAMAEGWRFVHAMYHLETISPNPWNYRSKLTDCDHLVIYDPDGKFVAILPDSVEDRFEKKVYNRLIPNYFSKRNQVRMREALGEHTFDPVIAAVDGGSQLMFTLDGKQHLLSGKLESHLVARAYIMVMETRNKVIPEEKGGVYLAFPKP